MQTLVISLPHCADRRRRVRQQLDGLGVDFEFFDAVDGARVDFPLADKRNDPLSIGRFGYVLTQGELACYASHYLVWKKCVTENRVLLVCEDNVQLHNIFRQVYAHLPQLAERYPFLKLSGITSRRYRRVASLARDLSRDLSIVRHFGLVCGSSCYLLTPGAAEAFLAASTSFVQPVDNFMEKSWLHGVPVYSLRPYPAARAEVRSLIGNRKDKKQPLGWNKKTRVELFRVYEQARQRLFFLFCR